MMLPDKQATSLRVAAVQMNSGDDVDANLQQAQVLCSAAAADGAELILLPENFAFLTARDADKLRIQEPETEARLQAFVRDLAMQLGCVIVAGAMPVTGEGDHRPWSQSRVVGADGRLLGSYNKMHLFDVALPESDEYYRESGCTRPGSEPVCVDAAGTRLGLSICYDLRFPELYRTLGHQGAELLTVPAAFTVPTGQAHWELLLRARAVENLACVVAAGQTGTHPGGRRTWGHSMIVDPWGEILAVLPEGIGHICADLDLSALRDRRRSFPVLDHLRL